MKKYFELKAAVTYIENHLTDDLTQSEIARNAAVSLSALQKLFRYSLGYSLSEYITKRRMSEAAKRLVMENESVTTLAFDYGYNSVESFSRAFRRIYGILPSDFKREDKHGEIFTSLGISDDFIVRDSLRLTNALKENSDCYVVCFDIVGMIGINEISRQAGDIALASAMQRIHEHTDSNYYVFRIGGDEFAVITPFKDTEKAEKFMRDVLKHNRETFVFDGQGVPVCMRGWLGRNASVSEFDYPEKVLQENVKFKGKQ